MRSDRFGKSVSIKSTIEYARLAGIGRIIILDPKYEFAGQFPDCEVITDIADIERRMKQLVEEMQQRAKTGANSKTLIVFDEFADAVSSARSGKELDIKEQVQVGSTPTVARNTTSALSVVKSPSRRI